MLTETETTRYQADGYLIFPALLAGAARERRLALFEKLVERSKGMETSGDGFHLAPDADGKPTPGVLHKVQGVAVVDPGVLELAREPAILARVADLIGPELDVFGTKFFPMATKGATSTGWHTDNYYFGTDSERVVSCAIYLQDTDTQNGCLRVVPGSHREERASHAPGAGKMAHGHWAQIDESRAVDVVCPGGTVVLFSANLLHGARPNASGRPSYRTAWHYIPGDLALEQFPRGVYKDRHTVQGT